MDYTNSALALEYQGNYGTARRDLDVLDLVNNPGANGLCRVLGASLRKRAATSRWLRLVRCSMTEPIRS